MNEKLRRRVQKIGYFVSLLAGIAFGVLWFMLYALFFSSFHSPLVTFFLAIPFGFGIVLSWFVPVLSRYCTPGSLFSSLFCTDIAQINFYICSSMLFWCLVFFFVYRHWLKKYRAHYV